MYFEGGGVYVKWTGTNNGGGMGGQKLEVSSEHVFWLIPWTYFKPFSSVSMFLLFTMNRCLSGTSFLCKYFCPKSKDEPMLYLTSFKIAPDFVNN